MGAVAGRSKHHRGAPAQHPVPSSVAVLRNRHESQTVTRFAMATSPAHLIYVDDDLPGITRKRAGKGWAYFDPEGQLITNSAEKKRLSSIALPPAYKDAWFCPADNGHILATGIDDKGRKQYRYHPEFRASREGEKFDGCVAFGHLLPLVRKRVDAVRLLDLGAVRIGNDMYAKANKSFGATTLRRRHAQVSGHTLKLRYIGKAGKLQQVTLSDRALARFVQAMQDLPGQRLFQWVEEDGAHDVGSACVNDYLRETMGHTFTAKNFRTWHASVLGYRLLAEAKGRLTIKAVLQEVADHLGNTPAVTRRSYIHPAVIALVDRQEEWRATLQLPRRTQWLSRYERGLLELLEESPPAAELLAAA
jgi:DNA topoisomerase-1